MNKLAQINLYNDPDGFTGFGSLGFQGALKANNAGLLFNSFISKAIGVITVVAFVWFVFTIVTGAISIISSGGDKQSLESAKKKITHAIIGLVVLIAGLFIVSLIGTIFGIGNILNPAELINQISK